MTRALFPSGVVLASSKVIFEGDNTPALYVGVADKTGHIELYRVPDEAKVNLETPRPLPASPLVPFSIKGASVDFEVGNRCSTLEVNALKVARELLESLQTLTEARTVKEEAKRILGGRHG
jgi:hypothetical protein